MNRSMLTLALCVSLAPLAAGCDGETIEEEPIGEASDQANGSDDPSDDGSDGEEDEGGRREAKVGEDVDPSDPDFDQCNEGDSGPCGQSGVQFCIDPELENHWIWGACDESGSSASTPLVLSFDGAEPTMSVGASTTFDLSGLGVHGATDWPAARTPWLALDRDGDGRITDGQELFGSAVRLASGALATHGFEALAELDANADGVLDARDPRFGELLVWTDGDGDRASSGHELSSAGQHGLVSIQLAHRSERICDARGNCGIERATFTFRGASGDLRTGEVVDVHLAYQRPRGD